MKNLLVLTCLMVTVCAATQDLHVTDEIRLTHHLLKKYEKIGTLGRPVAKDNDPWNVTFHISLQKILHIDEEYETMEVEMWHSIMWSDFYLNWNKAEYNVDMVRLRPSDVMVPDIMLYNGVSPAEHTYPANVIVFPGSCMHIQPVKQRVSCYAIGRDEFICDLKFGSWTFNDNKLNVRLGMDHVDIEYFKPNKAWAIKKTSAVKNVKHYPGYPEPYADLTFSIQLKRLSSKNTL